MKRKKIEIEDINTLFTFLMPKIGNESKLQIHSLLSLVVSTLILMVSFTSPALAEQQVIIEKNITDVGGNGSNAHVTGANQTINYTINVTNIVGSLLEDVNISDPMINLQNYTSIGQGESWIYNGTYNVTQEDLNSNGSGTGYINNTVNVSVNDEPAGNATASVPIDQNANLTVEKMVTNVSGHGPEGYVTQAGDVIAYEINLTNTGNIDLTNEDFQEGNITDSLFELQDPRQSINDDEILEVGEVLTLQGNYTVSQEDIDSNGNGTGFIINNVTVESAFGTKNATVSTPIANYTIEKTVTNITGNENGNITAAGNVINYQIVVDNLGQVNLTNVTVNDPLLGGQLNITNLDIGTNETLYGNYTVNQTDIDNNGGGDEFINNTATVDCDQLDPKNASTAAHIDQTPYWVNKTVLNVAGKGPFTNVTKAGDVINYQINVTNYGGLSFQPVSIYDSLTTITGPTESKTSDKILSPGEIWIYTGNYTVTQDDLNDNGGGDGFINNTAILNFYGGVNRSKDNKLVSVEYSTATVPVEQHPSCTIDKTVSEISGGIAGNVTKAGNVIRYKINVTNDGNLNLTNVSLDDTLLISSLSGPGESNATDGVLVPGENWTYTGNYTVTQTDINNNGNEVEINDGNITNQATVDCDQFNESKSVNVSTHIDQTPYWVNKTVTDVAGKGPLANATKAGDVITYLVNVTNYGGLPFKPVNIYDSLVPLTGPNESISNNRILDPGESWYYTGSYTVTQSDLNSKVNGTEIIKNTAIADFFGGVLKSEQLKVGSNSSSTEVPADYNPSFTVNKTVIDVGGNGSAANITKAGDNVTYEINVTNDGNIDLTNVTVNDSLVNLTTPSESKSEDGILNPDESWIYNVTYTVSQAEINSNGDSDGFLNNTVTVQADQLVEYLGYPKNASAAVPIFWNPVYNVNKTVIDVAGNGSDANITKAGDIVEYQVNLTNDGNVDITNATVNDSLVNLSSPLESENEDGILEVGEIWTLFGNYTVSQTDVNNNGTKGTGFLNNTVTVDSDQLEQESSSAEVPIFWNPVYNITKTVLDVAGNGSIANITKAGDKVEYQIYLTNDGNVDLSNVTVNDSLITLSEPVESQTADLILSPGENWTYTGNYTITKGDISSKGGGDSFLNNTATVLCDQLGEKSASAAVSLEHSPAYSINDTSVSVSGKGPSAIITAAGDELSCQFNLTNDGNVDITNVTVNCTLFNFTGPIESLNPDGILEVGENWTYTGNYTVTQGDINNNGTTGNGFLDCNTTVSCTELESLNFSSQFPIDRAPSYSIFKSSIGADETGDCIINRPDDIIEYRIVVKNDGNVDLTNVSVNDSLVNLTGPAGNENDPDVLNPGELWVYTGNYSVTSNDINSESGNVSNTATIVCDQLPEKNSSVEMPVARKADLSIYKSVIGIDEAGDFMVDNVGDVINYQIAVRNNGDIDLKNVSVSDPNIPGLEGPTGYGVDSGVLKPGKTWVYTGNYTVTPEDLENEGEGSGFIKNTATVSCDKLPNESSSTILPIIRVPIIVVTPETGSPVLVVDFTASPEGGSAPLSVQFTDKSQNATSWRWDFNGDGIADSTAQNPPAYTYTNAGTYTANLTVSNANGSASKTATITVLETSTGSSDSSSSSGGSSGGSSGSGSGGNSGSGEPASNIEAKEISQAFIGSGSTARFDFPKNATPVIYLNFDSKKTFGKTNTIVEMLKGKSTFASISPSNEVYKYVNIWIGNSGIVSNNLENAVVCFRVEKSWIQDKKIDQSSIILNRYSNSKWEQLQTNQSGEDSSYLYFTAKTPGFSPFAITGKTTGAGTEVQSGTGSQKPEQNNGGTAANTENKNNTSIPAKQSKKTPGFEIICGITALFAAVLLYGRK